MKAQKIVIDLVDYEDIPLDEYGTARLVGPGINVPCRCRHSRWRYDVWFQHAGLNWQGHRHNNNGHNEGRIYRVTARSVGRTKYESPYDNAVVPNDLLQVCYTIFGQAVQQLLQELVNRGWKIEPPEK